MRPMSCPARTSSFATSSGGIQRGCSMTKRYMSTTHRQPSGPGRRGPGRIPAAGRRRDPGPPLVVGPPAGEGRVARDEAQPVDGHADRLAGERVATELLAEQLVAVDAQAAR